MKSFKSAKEILSSDPLGDHHNQDKQSSFKSARQLLNEPSEDHHHNQDENKSWDQYNQDENTEYPNKKIKFNEEEVTKKTSCVTLKGVGLSNCVASIDDFKDLCDSVKTDSQVSLLRDSGNEHDQLALAIVYQENHIGYISWYLAKHISPKIDDGIISCSDCHIKSIEDRRPHHVQIEVKLTGTEHVIDQLISELEKSEHFQKVDVKNKIKYVPVPTISHTLATEESNAARSVDESGG